MNLIKNVDATWDASKGRVRQDLDTIQRTFNGLQAQLDALTKRFNTAAPVPPAVISAANTVTTFEGDALRSVATVPHGGLVGNGTITNPLGVSVDGSTVTINSDGQLVSGAGTGAVIHSVSGVITDAQLRALNSTPVTLLAAAGAGLVNAPLLFLAHTTMVTGYTNSRSADVRYTNNPGAPIFPLGTFITNTIIQRWFISQIAGNLSFSDVAGGDPANQNIQIIASGDNTGGNVLNQFTYSMYYLTVSMP